MDHPEDEYRDGGEHHGKQDDEEAVARYEEFKKSVEAKMVLCNSNLNPKIPDLRPNMARFSSIEEVNEALIELEEHELTLSTDEANSEKHSRHSRNASGSLTVNGKNLADGIAENGGLHEAVEEIDSDSRSGTIGPEGHGDEEDLDDDNHDYVCDTQNGYDDGVILLLMKMKKPVLGRK